MGLTGKKTPPQCDDILYGFLKMLQPADGEGPRINMDTVLLAGYARPRAGERVMELGCAHGGITLILAKRYPDAAFEGLDLQPSLIDMARENALRNGLNDRVNFTCGDLRNIRKLYSHQSFDALVVNPPYEDPGFGVGSRSAANRSARQGETCTLEDVCLAARFLLKNGGRLYMVMRALRLADTLALLKKNHLEPRRVRMVYPLPGKNASVFLTEACRAGGAALTVQPPLFISDEKGNYTPELMSFYGPQPPELQ
ncbi:MAG: tRNA1(Val) (adenine(37)-N6)-methyltransferase [Pyramidobacter sp.]|jgi:tRNA1Val (adenine37-N6)-methyltransferase